MFHGSILIDADRVEPWSVSEPTAVTVESLPESADRGILLIGCGAAFVGEPIGLRAALRERGVALEWMDTGAACRTFNVLVLEGREVTAALIAV